MRSELKDICKFIINSRSVLILAHTDPDGDAIGSMIALYILLKAKKMKVDMYCPDDVPEIYRFLPFAKRIMIKPPKNKVYDLSIAVDCGDINRIGPDIDPIKLSKTLINIDHHPDNTKYGDMNYIAGVSSVSEIIYEMFDICNIKIDKNAAICLYVGIMTDTGNFRYDYTSADTFRMAADLADKGADVSRIAMKVYEAKTLSSQKVLGAAMYMLEGSRSGKVVWTSLNKDLMYAIGAKSEDLTGIVDQLRSIKGVEVAIMFREEDEGIKVNFRSKYKINVSHIAQILGGGGHVRAAGTMIKGDMDDVKKKVLKEVFKVIK